MNIGDGNGDMFGRDESEPLDFAGCVQGCLMVSMILIVGYGAIYLFLRFVVGAGY